MSSLETLISGLNELEEQLKNAAGSFFEKLDRMSYRMTIDGLKSQDPEAVKVVLDQLVKDNKKDAVPPIYLVSVAHPVPWVRDQASKALSHFISKDELQKLTAGKNPKEAVQALVQQYGHFRA